MATGHNYSNISIIERVKINQNILSVSLAHCNLSYQFFIFIDKSKLRCVVFIITC